MKLYEVQRNSFVKVKSDVQGPPGAKPVMAGDTIKFHHCDGMYSYCHDEAGDVVHLPAWEEVEVVQ